MPVHGCTMSVPPHALVLVLGDLGHSPRMLNHVRELLNYGYTVDFAGYLESELPFGLTKTKALHVISIPDRWPSFSALPAVFAKIIAIFIKVIFQVFFLLWMVLGMKRHPTVILVQTPPVLPTIPFAYFLAKISRARLIVDWHNVGYTILAQNLKVPSLITIAKNIELFLARTADVNLVVSLAQKDWMRRNAKVQSIVAYDRPVPESFSRLPRAERLAFRANLRERLGWDREDDVPIVVSSTSWTKDEDFNILVDALPLINHRIQLIISGKGPLREHYENQILTLGLAHVQFATLWVPFEDYAKLLGSADLGICLHASSSGIDLPMKAMDMFGAGLPMAALQYPAITEVINHGKTGLLFQDCKELAAAMDAVVEETVQLSIPHLETWHEQWDRVIRPILQKSI